MHLSLGIFLCSFYPYTVGSGGCLWNCSHGAAWKERDKKACVDRPVSSQRLQPGFRAAIFTKHSAASWAAGSALSSSLQVHRDPGWQHSWVHWWWMWAISLENSRLHVQRPTLCSLYWKYHAVKPLVAPGQALFPFSFTGSALWPNGNTCHHFFPPTNAYSPSTTGLKLLFFSDQYARKGSVGSKLYKSLRMPLWEAMLLSWALIIHLWICLCLSLLCLR